MGTNLPWIVAAADLRHSTNAFAATVRQTPVSANTIKSPSNTTDSDDPQQGFFERYEFWFIVAGIVFLLGFYKAWAARCPNCRAWFSNIVMGRKLINERQGSKTVNREDRHVDKKGQLIKTVRRQEQVSVVVREYDVYHKCGRCKHEWVTQQSTEREV